MGTTQKSTGIRGATLVELLVAVAIGAILLTLVTRFFASQNKTYVQQMNSADLRGGLRAAMDLVQRELRNAGYDPLGKGFVGVEVDTTRLKLRADLNGDGDVADADEAIEYRLDKTQGFLLRGPIVASGVTATPDVVLEDVDTFYLEYTSASGTKLVASGSAADVRQVRVRLKARYDGNLGAQKKQLGVQRNVVDITLSPRNLGLPKMSISGADVPGAGQWAVCCRAWRHARSRQFARAARSRQRQRCRG